MKGTSSVASSGVVPELLTSYNYEIWSVVMQNYLRGQGLWDVVESSASEVENEEASKKVEEHIEKGVESASEIEIVEASKKMEEDIEKGVESASKVEIVEASKKMEEDIEKGYVRSEASWKIKDAKALHIIQLSCGRQILDEISHSKTANEAWISLKEKYGKDLGAKFDPRAISTYWSGQFNELMSEKWMYSDIYETTDSGWTVLHAVALTGDTRSVELLVEWGGDDLVGMADGNGYTALTLAAQYSGNNAEIAKCLVERKDGTTREELLVMETNEKEIPVLLAAAQGHKELTTYLYSKTPPEVFDGDCRRNRIFLVARCITAEIFGVALKLLIRYPDLSRAALLNLSDFSTENLLRKRVEGNFSILGALANMPSAFPSGRRFGLLQQYIYDLLLSSVKSEFIKSYGDGNYPLYMDRMREMLTRRGGVISKTKLAQWLPGLLDRLRPPLGIIAYLLVQIFKWLNIFGIRRIYDQEYTHYEVLEILDCFSNSIAEFTESQIRKTSADDAFLHAAQHGIIEFVYRMGVIHSNHDHLLAVDSCRRDIFSVAILNRKQNIFQLMHHLMGVRKEIFRYRTDAFGNNLLHLAAHLGPSSDLDSRSGAALQMQREVQWFKVVEEFVHPLCKEAKNRDGKKPHELFTEHHEDLVKEGEKWAKGAAKSYTIVGTLITTIMFAAAFTVPGGNNQVTGLPIFLHDNIFTTFLVADAVSLFTSATSVIIFIGILTSRYAEQDFLKSLPKKLLAGLFFLILSVCSMIVAFCAALAIIFKGYQSHKWFIIPSLSLASIPIIILVTSQLRLMYDIFHSTWNNPIGSAVSGVINPPSGLEFVIKLKLKLKPESFSTPTTTEDVGVDVVIL